MQCLLAIAVFAVTSFEVTVRTLDGNTGQGAIAAWDDSGFELENGEGSPQRISRDDLAEISLAASSRQLASPSIELLLVDGTLPAKDVGWQGEQVEIVSSIGNTKWDLPIESVVAVRFDLSEPGQDAAWRQLTERSRTSDWLVVHKKNRGTLDYFESVVQRVTPDSISLLLDDEPMEVSREKVFGIAYYRREADVPLQKKVQVLGPHGLSLTAREVHFGTSVVVVELSGGHEVRLPAEAVTKLVFSTDKTIYLTDLEPITDSSRWRPYFALPASSPLLESWGLPRRNESYMGSRLQLIVLGQDGLPVIQDFERGLAIRSRTEQRYLIPEDCQVLKAVVGMDPAAHEDADALLSVEADGENLGQWRLERSRPAQPIEVNIADKRKLRLIVDFGSGTDTGDVVHLCEPRLIK